MLNFGGVVTIWESKLKSSWWFFTNPCVNNMGKSNWIISPNRVEHGWTYKKYLSCHHLEMFSYALSTSETAWTSHRVGGCWRTFATILDLHHYRVVCWIDVLQGGSQLLSCICNPIPMVYSRSASTACNLHLSSRQPSHTATWVPDQHSKSAFASNVNWAAFPKCCCTSGLSATQIRQVIARSQLWICCFCQIRIIGDQACFIGILIMVYYVSSPFKPKQPGFFSLLNSKSPWTWAFSRHLSLKEIWDLGSDMVEITQH